MDGDLDRQAAAIAGATMQVLDLADELQDHAVDEPAARAVRPETVVLEPMLRAAIVGVDAMLGPSRRQWRLAPDIAGIRLRADRRALAQILTRVGRVPGGGVGAVGKSPAEATAESLA